MTDQQHPQVPDHVNTAEETLGSPTPQPADGPVRDPEDWATGDQPMTPAQRDYLDSLASRAGEQLPADLTKAEASQHIDRLQGGQGSGSGGQSW